MNSRTPSEAACRVVIRGRVQGVYFRASAAEQAESQALRGFARNQRDGSVLVYAQGERAALERLIRWLHDGPPMAQVQSVQVEWIDPASMEWPAGFLRR